jgi:hypothetical protein
MSERPRHSSTPASTSGAILCRHVSFTTLSRSYSHGSLSQSSNSISATISDLRCRYSTLIALWDCGLSDWGLEALLGGSFAIFLKLVRESIIVVFDGFIFSYDGKRWGGPYYVTFNIILNVFKLTTTCFCTCF